MQCHPDAPYLHVIWNSWELEQSLPSAAAFLASCFLVMMSFGHLEEERAHVLLALYCSTVPAYTLPAAGTFPLSHSHVLLSSSQLTHSQPSPPTLSHPSLQPVFPLFGTLLLFRASQHPVSRLFDTSLSPIPVQLKTDRALLGSITAAVTTTKPRHSWFSSPGTRRRSAASHRGLEED